MISATTGTPIVTALKSVLPQKIRARLPAADEDAHQDEAKEAQTAVAAVAVERHPERTRRDDPGVRKATEPHPARPLGHQDIGEDVADLGQYARADRHHLVAHPRTVCPPTATPVPESRIRDGQGALI
ncbi:hypothetical protein [Streptomyces sp. NPDC048277]|uniref:hypothetical protein n=1 Tax=Streptomyces sp. NPDC048277 TaxID=3155027 RepID=UPI0033E2C4E9